MIRPEFKLETEYAVRVCDICAEMCSAPFLKTFLGGAQVSDICMPCAEGIAHLITPKKRAAVAAGV